MFPREKPKPRFHLPRDAQGKVGGGSIIHRNHDRAPQRASKKCCNPFCGIFAPEHDSFTLANATPPQLLCEPRGHFQHLAVGKPLHAVASALPVGSLTSMRLEIFQKELREGFGHNMAARKTFV